MKAIAYRHSLPATDTAALEDVTLPDPVPAPRDLLVRVKAISVNPVDTKMRRYAPPEAGGLKVLGWDAVGTVEAVGSAANGFKPGDRVWYAGAIDRPGVNSELHVVDERIVSLAPSTLEDPQAAALPLTAITAWELLFDRFGITPGGGKNNGEGQTLLVVGGAGGVGSILIQLARELTQLRVVATASRPETRQWCLDLGAHAVVDHRQPLSEALAAAGIAQVDYAACLTNTAQHYTELIKAIAPQGKFGMIDDMEGLNPTLLREKSISLHTELMYTRSLFQTPDMAEQGKLLGEVARLVDAGRVRSTAQEHYGRINAANLRRAHELLESGRALGKVVLEGF